MDSLCFLMKSQLFGEFPNLSNMNSDFAPTAKDSSQREKPSYICGLRARIEWEPVSEHSTRSDRVTNIGYLLSSRAVFGWILFELNSGCGDLGKRAEVFCLL